MKIYLRLLTFFCVQLILSDVFAQNPTSSFTYNGTCEKAGTTFTSSSTTPVGQIIRYWWNFGTVNLGDTSALANPQFPYSAPGDYLVKLVVWNSLNFRDTSMQIISIKPKPDAISQIDVPCIPDPITMADVSTVSEGTITSRVWYFDTLAFSNQSSWSYSPFAEDSYTVTLEVISNYGCKDIVTDTIDYTDKPVTDINLSSPTVICDGDTVVVSVSGASTYLWNDSSTNRNKSLYAAGQYVVRGFTGNLCFSDDTMDVVIAPSPVADAGVDTTIDLGFSAQLRGSGGSTYLWSPSESLSDAEIANPIATPRQDTRYLLKVINSSGCSDFDSVLIKVNQVINIKVHNLITPNNDGINDAWDLSNLPNINNAHVFVFNRWGWEVFSSESYNHDWQGTFNGEPLVDGTYVYVIEFNNGILDPLRGTLEIVRNTQK